MKEVRPTLLYLLHAFVSYQHCVSTAWDLLKFERFNYVLKRF